MKNNDLNVVLSIYAVLSLCFVLVLSLNSLGLKYLSAWAEARAKQIDQNRKALAASKDAARETKLIAQIRLGIESERSSFGHKTVNLDTRPK